MASSETACLICGRTTNTHVDRIGIGTGPTIRCEVCGWYSPSVDFVQYVTLGDDDKPLVSAAIRDVTERDPHRLFVLTAEVYRQILTASTLSVGEKVDGLLRALGRLCKRPGGQVRLDPDVDYPLIQAGGPTELISYLQHAQSLGLVDLGEMMNEGIDCELTIPGWQRLEPVREVGGEPGTCFVAMWFDASMTEAYSLGIEPAIEQDCGLRAVRIDRVEHNNLDYR